MHVSGKKVHDDLSRSSRTRNVANRRWADILFEACLNHGAGLLPPETQHIFHSLDDALRRPGPINTIHMGNLSSIAWPRDGEDGSSTTSFNQGIMQLIGRIVRSVIPGRRTESAQQISPSIQHSQRADADETAAGGGRMLSDIVTRLKAEEFLSSIRVGSADASDTQHLPVVFVNSLPDSPFDEGSVKDFVQQAVMPKNLGVVETVRAGKRMEALKSCWAISWFNV